MNAIVDSSPRVYLYSNTKLVDACCVLGVHIPELCWQAADEQRVLQAHGLGGMGGAAGGGVGYGGSALAAGGALGSGPQVGNLGVRPAAGSWVVRLRLRAL